MKVRTLKGNDRGVSNVITTILLFSVFMVIFSTIMSVYIPQWIGGREYEHSVKVSEDFLKIKSTIDLQIFQGEEGVSLSTPISVGSPGLPFNGMGTVAGTLSLYTSDANFNTTINDTTNGITLARAYGSMRYRAIYTNYPMQRHVMEGGAVIMEQGESHQVRANPSMDFKVQSRPYLLYDNSSSQGLPSDYGGYGNYGTGDTYAGDNAGWDFSFDGFGGSMNLSFEAWDIDNATTLEIIVENAKGTFSLGYASPTPANTWQTQYISIKNEYLVDEGFNANTIRFVSHYPSDPWRVRNVTGTGRISTLHMTLVTFMGQETSVTSTENKYVETTLLGTQEITYDDMNRNITITINTSYGDAWTNIYSEGMNSSSNVVYGEDFAISRQDYTAGTATWSIVTISVYNLDAIYITNAAVRVEIV